MTPEREFILTALSQYLDRQPEQAKNSVMDLCTKYLDQYNKLQHLEEHCQLLEEKIEEMKLDYQLLSAELENERQNSQALSITRKSIELPIFVSNSSYFE